MILGLAGLLIVIDFLAFLGLNVLLKDIHLGIIETILKVVYWIFTAFIIGLIYYSYTNHNIDSKRQHRILAFIFSLTMMSFLPKIIFTIFYGIGTLGSVVYGFSILPFSFNPYAGKIALIATQGGLMLGVGIFFLLLEGVTTGKHRHTIKRISLTFDHLPPAFDGFKIVHFTDLHLGSFNDNHKAVKKAVRKINHLHPDIICFTGDMVNNYAAETAGWEPVLEKLSAKEGMFSVLGNHDYGDYSHWPSQDAKQQNLSELLNFQWHCGFEVLMNEAAVIERDGEKIAVIGVENWGKPPFKQYGNLEKAKAKVGDIHFKLLLSHDPSHWEIEVLEDPEIALTLSGHTHGAQFGFRFGKRNWSPVQYKYKRWQGLHKVGKQYLYVNVGLGFLSFPGRIGIRPEITLIELKTGKDHGAAAAKSERIKEEV